MSTYTSLDTFRTIGGQDGISDHSKLTVSWFVALDDRLLNVESVLLSSVKIERRANDGRVMDGVMVPVDQLLPLYQELGAILAEQQQIERAPASELHEGEEEPRETTGQTFTVTDPEQSR
jgi:hypothetical protein